MPEPATTSFHRARHQDFTRSGFARHPRADVHGDAAHGAARELDLARVQARPDLEAEAAGAPEKQLVAVSAGLSGSPTCTHSPSTS
jgi:hypothetical protein